MNAIVYDLRAVTPELIVLVAASLLLLARPGRVATFGIAFTSLLIAALWTAFDQWGIRHLFFSRAYIIAPGATLLKILVLAATALALFLVEEDRKVRLHHPETVALMLFSSFGAMLLIAANHLAVAYLAFEILSIAGYALVGSVKGDRKGVEGGLKYAIFGGAASAFLLYGFSLVYGITGSMAFGALNPAVFSSPAGVLAVLLVFVGAMYKLAAAPFHYWCPDAFEGAPTSVAGFLSIVPKLGGFGFLYSLLALFNGSKPFLNLLAAAAFLSMTLGNLAALHQTNLKRLLAYSSIAHAGYLLAAASVPDANGAFAVLFYLGVYLFMNLGAFLVAAIVAPDAEIKDFRGLSRRNSFAAFMMAVFLFSLTGLPPFGGFTGKLFILKALIHANSWGLIAALVVNTVISLYYYMRIIREMYLERPREEFPLKTALTSEIALSFMAGVIFVLGLLWGEAARICQEAAGLF